jgi:hypothetical protein
LQAAGSIHPAPAGNHAQPGWRDTFLPGSLFRRRALRPAEMRITLPAWRDAGHSLFDAVKLGLTTALSLESAVHFQKWR